MGLNSPPPALRTRGVGQEYGDGVVTAVDRGLRLEGPVAGLRVPQLGGMDGLARSEVIEPVHLGPPFPCVPPMTSTVPSGSSVALCWRRAKCMSSVFFHCGTVSLRSRISASLSGAFPLTDIQDLAVIIQYRRSIILKSVTDPGFWKGVQFPAPARV